MNTALKAAGLALLLVACVCFCQVSVLLTQAGEAEARIEEAVAVRVDRETAVHSLRLAAIEEAAEREIHGLRADVMGRLTVQMRGGVRVIDQRLAGIADVADNQLTATNWVLNRQLSIANSNLAQVGNAAIETMQPIHDSATQVAAAMPLFLNCDHNADCVYNRYVGVSRAAERFTGDFAAWVHFQTRPQSKKQKALNALITIGVIGGRAATR